MPSTLTSPANLLTWKRACKGQKGQANKKKLCNKMRELLHLPKQKLSQLTEQSSQR